MKKVIIALAFLFYAGFVFGQNPTVNILCSSVNCFFTDPSPETAFYNAIVNDGAFTSANGWSKTTIPISWITIGGGAIVSGQGTTLGVCSWSNTPNTPIKKIKVTVTYTKTGQANVTATDEQIVIVKHIAPITSITVTGASPSSPSNGGTTSIPCGTGSFTMSVPTPVTDPVATVTYTWITPNGWTGSSTTNSIA